MSTDTHFRRSEPGVFRCHQCGREGTRGFREIPAVTITHLGAPPFVVGPFIECANKNACRKRWPKQTEVEW